MVVKGEAIKQKRVQNQSSSFSSSASGGLLNRLSLSVSSQDSISSSDGVGEGGLSVNALNIHARGMSEKPRGRGSLPGGYSNSALAASKAASLSPRKQSLSLSPRSAAPVSPKKAAPLSPAKGDASNGSPRRGVGSAKAFKTKTTVAAAVEARKGSNQTNKVDGQSPPGKGGGSGFNDSDDENQTTRSGSGGGGRGGGGGGNAIQFNDDVDDEDDDLGGEGDPEEDVVESGRGGSKHSVGLRPNGSGRRARRAGKAVEQTYVVPPGAKAIPIKVFEVEF
jgi:hypothetical protein